MVVVGILISDGLIDEQSIIGLNAPLLPEITQLLMFGRRYSDSCYETKLKRTQCSCRNVFFQSLDAAAAAKRRPKSRMQREEDELDLQVCGRDYWEGRVGIQ